MIWHYPYYYDKRSVSECSTSLVAMADNNYKVWSGQVHHRYQMEKCQRRRAMRKAEGLISGRRYVHPRPFPAALPLSPPPHFDVGSVPSWNHTQGDANAEGEGFHARTWKQRRIWKFRNFCRQQGVAQELSLPEIHSTSYH